METKKTVEITVPEGMKLVENKNSDGNVISYQVVKDESTIESKSKEQEMKEFLAPFLNNLTLVRYDREPSWVYFKQGNVFLFEFYENPITKRQYFYVDHDSIWSVFNKRFKLSDIETQAFIKNQVETNLKFLDVTPLDNTPVSLFFRMK